MKKGIVLLLAAFLLGTAPVYAEGPKRDVFQGKLFPPNVILEHKAALDLSKEQFTQIRATVVEVQAGVAEHEWDMQEAYQAVMRELDKTPVDEKRVLEHATAALLAENEVKKKQMAMLVRLRNLLTADQVAYLKSRQPQ